MRKAANKAVDVQQMLGPDGPGGGGASAEARHHERDVAEVEQKKPRAG
jgi:hypothetical protein